MVEVPLFKRLIKGINDRIWDIPGYLIAMTAMSFAPYPFFGRLAISFAAAFIYFSMVALVRRVWLHYHRTSN